MNRSFNRLLTFALCFLAIANLRADDTQSKEARLREALKTVVEQLRAAQDQLAAAQTAQAESDRQLTLSNDALKKMTTDYNDLKAKSQAEHEVAVKTIAQLDEQNAFLQRLVEDRERKNYELFKTGNEVLVKYEKFGLGEAIEAKEPFVGLTRVKLENLVQDYEDKFAANKTYAGQPISSPPKAGTNPSSTADKAMAAETAPPLPTKEAPIATKASPSPASSGSTKSQTTAVQAAAATPAPAGPVKSKAPEPDKDKVIVRPGSK